MPVNIIEWFGTLTALIPLGEIYEQRMATQKLTITLLISIFGFLTGCSAKTAANPQDPYEPLNRKIFVVNDAFDSYFMKPVAKGYDAVLPNPVKKGISNAYSNVRLVPTIANDILQLQPIKAGEASFRFLINSTIGLAGLWDPASYMGLKHHKQDMGLTLAAWGWEDSAYFLIPFIGPSTVRDTGGFVVDEFVFYPLWRMKEKSARDKLYGLRVINKRYELLDADKFLDDAIDKYAMQRDAYLQHREAKIRKNKGHETEDTFIE